MNILHLGSAHLVGALRSHGHRVISVGFWASCDICIKRPISALTLYKQLAQDGFVPDAVLMVDDGNLPCFPHIEESPYPTVYYSIDTFCNPWHYPYGHAFDHVLVAQKDYVDSFTKENISSTWTPLFANSTRDKCTQDFSKRNIPVIFVGTVQSKNIPDREPFLKAFQKHHPLVIEQGPYVELYNQARMVLNTTAASEVNFRCFEAMACGCALIMENCDNGLDDLFTVGEHILPHYGRNQSIQAAAVARTALKHPETLALIAKQGHDEVLKKHMDIHRATDIIQLLENLIRTKTHEQRLQNLNRRKHLLSTAYGILAMELTNTLQDHAKFYERLYDLSKNA